MRWRFGIVFLQRRFHNVCRTRRGAAIGQTSHRSLWNVYWSRWNYRSVHLICKAVIDGRLLPLYSTCNEYLVVFIVEQNLVGISAVSLVIFCRCVEIHIMHRWAIMWKRDIVHKTENMQCITTPSMEDWATGNMHKNLVKLSHVVFKLMQADRQTDILITIFCTPPGQSINWARMWINHWSLLTYDQCNTRPAVTFPAAEHHCHVTVPNYTVS